MIHESKLQIGNYRITAELGHGACGNVYLGTHVFLPHRLVAVKVMNTALLNSLEGQERFRREAQFLDWLKHPHILPVIDVGVCEEYSYLVTEYASNGSLKDLLDQQPHRILSEEKALKILSQIGQALHYAHQNGVVHRDLKPANILFTAEGDALLADFGVALLLTTTQTERGDVEGTPAYMAPEQFQQIVSPKSDQYALGCIAYELFTGRVPFSAPDLATLMHQHLYETPVDPGCLNLDLPVHIRQALLKALAKERTARHRDVATFLAVLQIPLFQRSDPLAPRRSLTQSKRNACEHLDETTLELPCVFADYPETRGNVVQEQPTLETVFGALLNGVITIDAFGIITTWNTAASNLLRLNPQAVLGEHYQDVFRVRPYTYLVVLLQNALSQHSQSTMVSSAVDWSLGGELISLRFSVSALDTTNRCSGLVLVIEDRTEHTCLLAQAQNMRNMLELYVSPDVVEQFLHNPSTLELGGEIQDISVLFADIRNFTQLSEQLTPEQLTHVLNTYFDLMVTAVWEEEGTVTGFQGDGLMAIFNAPLSQSDHALRAVRTAWKMRRAVLAYQQVHPEDLPITFGIGVNTGKAIVGNFGARGLMQNYTAVGDTVNVAARLQAHASDNAILLHHSTFTRVRRAVKVDLLASLELKNKAEPLSAWLLEDVMKV